MPRHASHAERPAQPVRPTLPLLGRVTAFGAFLLALACLYTLTQPGGLPTTMDDAYTAAGSLGTVEAETAGKHSVRGDVDRDGHGKHRGAKAKQARAAARAEAARAAAKAKWKARQAARSAAATTASGGSGGSRPPAAPPVVPSTTDPTTGAMPADGRPVPTTQKLSWAPPQGWQNYPVKSVTAKNQFTMIDAGGGDVLVDLADDHAVGPITIRNCRNAVLIGGQIDVLPTAKVNGQDQRGVYVKDCTGTVHIEGLLINGAVPGSESDGIAASAPQAVLQIQNVRVEGMMGGLSSNHADVFQPWGGLKEFRIDRLTGSTNYQGLHIKEGQGQIGRGTIRNANVASSEVGPTDKGGQFLYLECNGYPLSLDNVYVQGRADREFGTSIYPKVGNDSCGAVVTSQGAVWPGYGELSGSVRAGRPAAGDFVPKNAVGLGYVSPGYL